MGRSGMRMLWLLMVTIFLAGVTLTPLAHAAGETKDAAKSKVKKKPKKIKTPSEPVVDAPPSVDSTSASRKEILGNLGLSPSPLVAFGITGGMIKSNGSGLEADFTYASGKSGTIAAKVTHIGGRYRKGLMKIGYIAGGAGLRMASGSWFVLNQTADTEYAAGSSLNAVTIDAAVGAQMQFGSIVIGADLLGISFPIFKMGVKKTVPDAEDYDAADADAQQAKFDKVASGMNMTLFKVGVGILL